MKGDWSIKSQEKHLIRSTEAQKTLGSFITSGLVRPYPNMAIFTVLARRWLMTKYQVCEASYWLTSLHFLYQ